MACENFTAHGSKVGRQIEIAALIENFRGKAGPAAVNLAAAYARAEDEHDIGMAMIGAPVAILPCGAPELRHSQEHDIFHAVA